MERLGYFLICKAILSQFTQLSQKTIFGSSTKWVSGGLLVLSLPFPTLIHSANHQSIQTLSTGVQ